MNASDVMPNRGRLRAWACAAAFVLVSTSLHAGHGPVSTRRLTQPDPLRPGSEMLEQSTVQKGLEYTLRTRPKAILPGELVSFEAVVRDISPQRLVSPALHLRIDRLGLWNRSPHTPDLFLPLNPDGPVKFSAVFFEPGTYEVVFRAGTEDAAGLLVTVQEPTAVGGWRALGVFFGFLGFVCLVTMIAGPRGRPMPRAAIDIPTAGRIGR